MDLLYYVTDLVNLKKLKGSLVLCGIHVYTFTFMLYLLRFWLFWGTSTSLLISIAFGSQRF